MDEFDLEALRDGLGVAGAFVLVIVGFFFLLFVSLEWPLWTLGLAGFCGLALLLLSLFAHRRLRIVRQMEALKDKLAGLESI